MSDYLEEKYKLDEQLDNVSHLWEVVYQRIESAYADIEAGHLTFEEMEAGKESDVDEVGILRECVYEVVQAAIIALRGM
jgi:hypothetical protein